MDTVTIEPLARGWAVRATDVANDLIFASGRAAEQCGRRLAEGFARAGRETVLQLRLRPGGNRTVKYLCLPPLPNERAPLLVEIPAVRFTPADPAREPARRGATGGDRALEQPRARPVGRASNQETDDG